MSFDIEMIERVYKTLGDKIAKAKAVLGRDMTLAEKILYSHLLGDVRELKRGQEYAGFAPDRVALQDVTGSMALLQLMQTEIKRVRVCSSVHTDHLIVAEEGAKKDLQKATKESEEVYNFLSDVSKKHGLDYWGPGSGIIHQIVLENYAFPGGLMIGTDSHTPNAGGLAMAAIGVGGTDAVDAMTGLPWELKAPKLVGVKLTGKLTPWASPKDVILKLCGILTVEGGTGKIIEYFGEGAKSLSCTGKGTICNMGAEIGATTSLFAYDESMHRYLIATGREDVAKLVETVTEHLVADPDVEKNPHKYFDEVVEINLDELEPHINGPFTPDKAWTLSQFGKAVIENNYPRNVSVALVGSCTNSSYEDLTRTLSLLEQAYDKGLKIKSKFTLTPGSERIRQTIERDGLLSKFEEMGISVLANACGPCIGQWKRTDIGDKEVNSIVTSFNRNFSKRNDGNPNTHCFVTSPETVVLFALSGDLTVNPLTQPLKNAQGEEVKLLPPTGQELPPKGFALGREAYQAPLEDGSAVNVRINPQSQFLQELKPFPAWDGKDIRDARVLIKVKGKCTTDHISMAGPWLRFRGHLQNISQNLLIGAVNAFNGKTNGVVNLLKEEETTVPASAAIYRDAGVSTVIIGDENYGEGSSREHAALEPRYMGARAVIAKSFARIHETNLKKHGMLALTFKNKDDYDKVREDDFVDLVNIRSIFGGLAPELHLKHSDGTMDIVPLKGSYNEQQARWFEAGSALNYIKHQEKREL